MIKDILTYLQWIPSVAGLVWLVLTGFMIFAILTLYREQNKLGREERWIIALLIFAGCIRYILLDLRVYQEWLGIQLLLFLPGLYIEW